MVFGGEVMNKPDADIVVVGGGIAGAYTAWQLLTRQPGNGQAADWAKLRDDKLKVVVLEGSDRIGGRMLSARSDRMPGTTAELGGMRYVVPGHSRMQKLVEQELGLSYHRQLVDAPENIAFLRGRILRMKELGDPARLPYFFSPSEMAWLSAVPSRTPAGLVGRVLAQLIPGIEAKASNADFRKYLSDVKIDGQPLWQLGLWNLLFRGMSPDAYISARNTIGYDSLLGNFNALDIAAEYFDFAPNTEYRMIDDGFERIPWELHQRILGAGGELRLNCWADGFIGTTLSDGTRGVEVRLRSGGSLTARAIVLALPRRSIELLRPEGEILSDRNDGFRHMLASVFPVPLLKIFLVYPECWWQDSGVTKGRSLTDMPLRQCYYWPSAKFDKGSITEFSPPGRHDPGMIMAYDDMANGTFWSGLDQRGEVHRAGLSLTDRSGAEAHTVGVTAQEMIQVGLSVPQKNVSGTDFSGRLQANWSALSATTHLWREAHRQLMVMHGVDSAPEPTDFAYMDWSRDPFGGGVHFWNPGYKSDDLRDKMIQPEPDFPCYVCGEAYSTKQSWVEGALQTAELVLAKFFDPVGRV